jgi:hypothetical protein
MGKRIRVALAATAVLALSCVAVASAQGATVPRWFLGWGAVAEPEPIKTYGPAGITFKLPGSAAEVLCHVSLQGTVVDPHEAAGIGEVTSLTMSKCRAPDAGCAGVKLEIVASGFPWPSHLVVEGSIRDLIEGVQLSVRCGGTEGLGKFAGMLSPVVNDQERTNGRCEPTKKPPCGLLEFDGEGLSGTAGTVTLKGIDKIEGPRRGYMRPVEVKLVTF